MLLTAPDAGSSVAVMHRLGVAWITGILLVLSACTASAQSASVENPTALTSGPTAKGSPSSSSPGNQPSSVLDGDWALWVTAQPSCPDLNGRRLHVAGGAASIAVGIVGWTDPVTLTGPATMDGASVSVDAERSKPTKDAVQLKGSLKGADTVTGKGTAGGVHPGGQNGYSCTFTFTLERLATDAGDACTALAVQAAVLDATSLPAVRIDPSTLQCAQGWATARVDPNQPAQEFAVAVQSKNGRWVRHSLSKACNWKHPEQGTPATAGRTRRIDLRRLSGMAPGNAGAATRRPPCRRRRRANLGCGRSPR